MGIPYYPYIWGFPSSWGYPFIAGWFSSWKIPSFEMDDDWGGPPWKHPYKPSSRGIRETDGLRPANMVLKRELWDEQAKSQATSVDLPYTSVYCMSNGLGTSLLYHVVSTSHKVQRTIPGARWNGMKWTRWIRDWTLFASNVELLLEKCCILLDSH